MFSNDAWHRLIRCTSTHLFFSHTVLLYYYIKWCRIGYRQQMRIGKTFVYVIRNNAGRMRTLAGFWAASLPASGISFK